MRACKSGIVQGLSVSLVGLWVACCVSIFDATKEPKEFRGMDVDESGADGPSRGPTGFIGISFRQCPWPNPSEPLELSPVRCCGVEKGEQRKRCVCEWWVC